MMTFIVTPDSREQFFRVSLWQRDFGLAVRIAPPSWSLHESFAGAPGQWLRYSSWILRSQASLNSRGT